MHAGSWRHIEPFPPICKRRREWLIAVSAMPVIPKLLRRDDIAVFTVENLYSLVTSNLEKKLGLGINVKRCNCTGGGHEYKRAQVVKFGCCLAERFAYFSNAGL